MFSLLPIARDPACCITSQRSQNPNLRLQAWSSSSSMRLFFKRWSNPTEPLQSHIPCVWLFPPLLLPTSVASSVHIVESLTSTVNFEYDQVLIMINIYTYIMIWHKPNSCNSEHDLEHDFVHEGEHQKARSRARFFARGKAPKSTILCTKENTQNNVCPKY